jgi:hypothetical protein
MNIFVATIAHLSLGTKRAPIQVELIGPTTSAAVITPQVHRLHHGRRKTIVEILPVCESGLYRVNWPDIGLSPPANLTRCKDAARAWAEQQLLTEQRKISVARRLKSLNNFWWSASPVRNSEPDLADDWPAVKGGTQ